MRPRTTDGVFVSCQPLGGARPGNVPHRCWDRGPVDPQAGTEKPSLREANANDH